jgi:preprotein translocase subunit SecG
MSSQPICPCCHSPQATQRVTAIVTGGTQQVRVITADLMPAAGVSRTNLAQMLAPPRQPSGGWLIIVLLFGLLLLSVPASCMITAVIVGLQGQAFEAAFTSGAAERIFAAVVGVAALASIAITVGIAQLGERRRRAATEQWNRQMARWQQSWYCHRCHAAFVAGSSQAVAPEQFGRILAA